MIFLGGILFALRLFNDVDLVFQSKKQGRVVILRETEICCGGSDMKSIQVKLTVTMLAIFLASLGMMGGLNYWKARSIITESVMKGMAEKAESSANDVGDWLESRKSELRFMAVAPVVMNGDKASIFPYLANASVANKAYDGFGYASSDGMFIGSAGSTGNVSERDYFQKAMKGEDFISDPLFSKTTNHLVTVAAVPVKTNGKVTGVLLGTVDMVELAKKVLDVRVGQTGYATVTQRDGLTVIHPDQAVAMKFNALTDSKADQRLKVLVERVSKGEKGMSTIQTAGGERYYAYAPIPGVTWGLTVNVPTAEVTSAVSALTWISFATTIVVLIIAASIIAWYARRIANPIKGLEAAANQIASGDLSLNSISIDTNDEISHLGQAFETMTMNLRKLVKQVGIATEQVMASSEELTASSEQSAQAATSIASSINQIAQGSEKQVAVVNKSSAIVQEISSTMQAISATASEVATMSEQAANLSLEGKTSVDRAVTQMDAVNVGAKQAQMAAVELKTSSAQIGEIVSLISTIAGQTNLLALNAAIEAARAGEQGRGFAVVADEVRKLAEQSGDAAHQIKVLISSNHDSIGKVVSSIDGAIQDILQGVDLVNAAGINFGAINGQVLQVADQVAIIAKAIKAAAVESQGIVSSIKEVENISRSAAGESQNVSATTEEQSASMEEIAASSQSLAKLAVGLQCAVSKFRV